jgi:hypothetical protein
MIDNLPKLIADFIVTYSAIQCVCWPIIWGFRGEIEGGEFFLAGAIIVATIRFTEFYFRDYDTDALDI